MRNYVDICCCFQIVAKCLRKMTGFVKKKIEILRANVKFDNIVQRNNYSVGSRAELNIPHTPSDPGGTHSYSVCTISGQPTCVTEVYGFGHWPTLQGTTVACQRPPLRTPAAVRWPPRFSKGRRLPPGGMRADMTAVVTTITRVDTMGQISKNTLSCNTYLSRISP